jgi:hypothetical protein
MDGTAGFRPHQANRSDNIGASLILGDDEPMSALIYPVASDGEAALRAPLGQALRAREAEILAGEPVIFK